MRTILILDDDDLMLKMLSKALELLGYQVRAVQSGAQALALLEQTRPLAMLVEVFLNHENGLDLIAALRRSSPGALIIAMAGGGRSLEPTTLQSIRNYGADAVLRKPITIETLKACLDGADNCVCSG